MLHKLYLTLTVPRKSSSIVSREAKGGRHQGHAGAMKVSVNEVEHCLCCPGVGDACDEAVLRNNVPIPARWKLNDSINAHVVQSVRG